MDEFNPVEAAKVVLIGGIANRIRTRYGSQKEAALDLGVDQGMISRLCAGKPERFSVSWLITLADRLGADISITVE